MPLRRFAAVSGFASASSNIRAPSPVNRRAMVNGVSFGSTWYVDPAPAVAKSAPSAAAHVFGPTTPSAVSPRFACHAFVAAAVAGPNLPSGATPMICCQSATSGPLEPCWIVACVVAGAVGGGIAMGIAGGKTVDGEAGTDVTTAATAAPCAAAHVLGPTTPSAVSPCCACHVLVAAAVAGPNLPSCVTPMMICQSTTSAPVDPCWSVACAPKSEDAAGAATGTAGLGGDAGVGLAADGMPAAVCAAAHVKGPTTPSVGKACRNWKSRVAASVFGPNWPSAVMPRIFCQRTTSGPVEPFWIVACG